MAALISLKGPLVYWLKQMMERGLRNDQACTLRVPVLALFQLLSSNSESEDSEY